MNDTILWQTKLAARLHDPIEKALILMRTAEGHEGGTSAELRRKLGLDDLPDAFQRAIKKADHWASAADRAAFPNRNRDGRYPAWQQTRFHERPVIIHPLTDHRRTLTVDKLGEVIEAADGFLLVVSYNPGYQNAMKDLKHSTRQRFVALEFDFPDEEREAQIIAHESGVDEHSAELLARLGSKIRNLREHGLEEGASTRVLIYAGRLIKEGISARRACQVGVTWGITDDPQIQRSIDEVVSSIFP